MPFVGCCYLFAHGNLGITWQSDNDASQQPPEGIVGYIAILLRLRVVQFKHSQAAKNVPALTEAAQRAGLFHAVSLARPASANIYGPCLNFKQEPSAFQSDVETYSMKYANVFM